MSTPTTTTVVTGELRIALEEIRVRENVRELDQAHVASLAQSIALRGVLVPLIVRIHDAGYELVAGYHRLHACRQLGLTEVPVVVREHEGSSADAAAENVARKQLDPLQEARAVEAMLGEGYTLDGVAQALGWTRQLVSARAKILKLTPVAQQLVGAGEIPVSAIDQLIEISAVSSSLAHAVAEAIAEGADGAQLVHNPSWLLGNVLRAAPKGTFGARLDLIDDRERNALRLGKKTDALAAEAEKLKSDLDRYSYGPARFRFADSDVDQARAAGVLIEFTDSGGAPIITDQALYRELAKQAIARTVQELRARVAAKGKNKRGSTAKKRTPREELDSEHRASLRELTTQAHGVNVDLGVALLSQLAVVAPDDLDIARFFAYGVLGAETDSFLGTSAHRTRTIAANGLRLVLEEHRSTITPKLKSGQPGKTKITYGDPDAAMRWLWKFIDGAKTAGELYGRVLVVFAAQHYASQLALPMSQRRGSVLPHSRKDTARKAFERATKHALPASHAQLQKAIADEARAYDKRIAQLENAARDARAVAATANRTGEQRNVDEPPVVGDEPLDEDLYDDEPGDLEDDGWREEE